MKKILVLLVIPLLFSCNTDLQTGAFLSGTVENLESGFFEFGGSGGAKDSILINENGSFEIDLSGLTEPYAYYLLSGNEFFRMYVAPGMKLDIKFDQNNFLESLMFKGKGADINNYLANKSRVFGDQMDYELFKLDPEEFRNWADEDLAARQDFLGKSEKKDDNDPYWTMEEGEVLFTWANNLGSYPSTHPYYAEIENFEVEDSFYSYKNKLNVNDAKYVESTAFNQYVSQYIRDDVAIRTKELSDADPEYRAPKIFSLKIAQELITNKEVFNGYIFRSVKGYISYYDLELIPQEIDFFLKNCDNEKYIADFNKEYEVWKKLAKGNQGFDFVGKDLKGNDVKFSDFKGKYVYIDVWATWCGPCKYEIPFLKKLENDYHNRNVIFLSYSIDDDKEAWLNFVPENELGGVQIIGENAWESAMTKYYKVNGVPTFMFFDPSGKIISVNMTRPSNQATRDKFESYNDL